MDYNLAVKLCYDICTKYISHIYFTLYTLESGSLVNSTNGFIALRGPLPHSLTASRPLPLLMR